MDPSGNMAEVIGKLLDAGKYLYIIKIMIETGIKKATPLGIGTSIVFTPSKAGETDEDLKNDVEFQKFLSGGGTGDPNKNNKKDKKDNNQPEKYSLKKFKNNKEANKIAEKLGYKNAEDLKRLFTFGEGTKFNMHYDTKTGEMILVSIRDASIKIATGLFK